MKEFFRASIAAVALASLPVLSPAQEIPTEVGVWNGTLQIPFLGVDSPFLVSIDRGDTQASGTQGNSSVRTLAYAALRASLVCFDTVKVFVGDGGGEASSTGFVRGTITAKCPDKTTITFSVHFVYDSGSDTGMLSFPDPNTAGIPPVPMTRVEFPPVFFRHAIKEMLNNTDVWVVQNLFDQFDDQTCPPGEFAIGIVGGFLQCGEP